jgi:hypothetical protein
MKKICLITLGCCLFVLTMPTTTALAAKADGRKGKLFAKYDQNKNDVLDEDEKKAIRDDFAKDKEGELKSLDKDGDGKLSDEELNALKPGSGKVKEAKVKKKAPEKEKAADDGKTAKTGDADKAKAEK